MWVLDDFSILLVAAMITDDDDDDDDVDMMTAQWLRWGDEVRWWCRHCDAVIGYWSDETGEGLSRSSSSEGGEGWADENDDG